MDPSPPLAAGGGRALSGRLLAAGPQAPGGSGRLRGRPSPCWRQAPGDCLGSWFSITVASQGRSEFRTRQFKPFIAFGKHAPLAGRDLLQFVPSGRM